MPSLTSVLEFRKQMYDESVELIAQKGHDYNRQQQDTGDTLFNLKVAAIMGIVDTPEQGILVRLMDKMMRLASLMKPGVSAQVKGESVRDTVKDIHNYADYALQLWLEQQVDASPVVANYCTYRHPGTDIPCAFADGHFGPHRCT